MQYTKMVHRVYFEAARLSGPGYHLDGLVLPFPWRVNRKSDAQGITHGIERPESRTKQDFCDPTLHANPFNIGTSHSGTSLGLDRFRPKLSTPGPRPVSGVMHPLVASPAPYPSILLPNRGILPVHMTACAPVLARRIAAE
jgi:hypothetical protein